MSEKALQSAVKKILGLTDEQYAELLYDKSDEDGKDDTIKKDATKIILSKNAEKVSEFKEKETTAFDNGYSKAKGEVLNSFDKQFKEKTKFESEKKGIELTIAYAESVKGSTKTDPTEEQVKKTSWYNELEQSNKDAIDTAIAEALREPNEKIKSFTDRENFTEMVTDVWAETTKLKPVIPDGLPGENLKKNYLNAFKNYTLKRENGTTIILDSKGERLQNSQGIGVLLPELVNDISKQHFTFAKQDPKGNAGNTGEPADPSETLTITSKEQFSELCRKYDGNVEMESKISKAYKIFKATQ